MEKFIFPKDQNIMAKLQEEMDQINQTGKQPKNPMIIVGKGALKQLGLEVGDFIGLLSPEDSVLDPTTSFKIIGYLSLIHI